ncbi:MAG: acetate--CoA ligase, partial [Bacteroidetes bacterium]|nr:acetate--CoA ligase [Bacteroidota bacterium]
LGITKGYSICIYIPMIPQAVYAMLACTRIGAVHTVVFAGFSAQSLADRINDCGCRLIITADAFYRGDKKISLKPIVDEAMQQCKTIEKCIVYNHLNEKSNVHKLYDIDYTHLVEGKSSICPAEAMQSEDPLFILYTSGSTGKPKGLVHTCGGYMVYSAYTFNQVFQYKPDYIHWCTADIGWVTGHSYLVYGPLLNKATSLLYEGVPTFPHPNRLWKIIEKHKVSIFYTAPTAIRSLMSFGEKPFDGIDLSSLKVLGTVGEPINSEAWEWYHKHVGNDNCPIVDTWWQTETGGVLISPLAGITPTKPTYATLPLPGVYTELVDEKGNVIEGNDVEGNLCISQPWPGIARSIYGDHERYRQTYFAMFANKYFTGDGAKRDADGYYRITGRVDDVINVSGHRIGTGEVEDAINEHSIVIESAIIAYPHDVKGQGLYAYVVCNGHDINEEALTNEIRTIVTAKIGAFAKPDKIQIVEGLPKTRSGKIMRRILRKIAENDHANLGDTSTLLDPKIVEKIWNERK